MNDGVQRSFQATPSASEARELLHCRQCSAPTTLAWDATKGRCPAGHEISQSDGLYSYSDPEDLRGLREVGTRDVQAQGYLSHCKFPVQVFRFNQFLSRLAPVQRNGPAIALDLGCGPGPYTSRLLEAGYSVLAVDFSGESLKLNRQSCGEQARGCTYVQADLNEFRMAGGSVDLLVMCDFLQHLGGAAAQANFLAKAFTWLKPGGRFYLSFFNFNVVNRAKGDRDGSFAGGSIPYSRCKLPEIRRAIPKDIIVERTIPMNIFHEVALDRVAASLPFASSLSRMISMAGARAGAVS
jgi:SAM-dependent methyltransferase